MSSASSNLAISFLGGQCNVLSALSPPFSTAVFSTGRLSRIVRSLVAGSFSVCPSFRHRLIRISLSLERKRKGPKRRSVSGRRRREKSLFGAQEREEEEKRRGLDGA